MKKTKIFISLLTVAAFVFNSVSFSFAAAKRDVNDPVLREIINELSKKMPKFVDKYGETVFVEDEPITRGTLIAAIYEYDKKTKPAAAVESASSGIAQITRKEFDSLKAKVTSLEKNKPSASSAQASNNVDMIALMAELQPNMPTLLDGSLENSKVFKSLKQQVANAKTSSKDSASASAVSKKEITELQTGLDQIQQSYAKLSKRIDELDSKTLAAAPSAKGSSKDSKDSSSVSKKEISELQNSLNQIQQSYVKLSKRIDELDDKALAAVASAEKASSNSNIDMTYINKQLNDIRKSVAAVPTSDEIKSEISRSKDITQADIDRIEKKLNKISKAEKASKKQSPENKKGATIATISLGITMIAALFVAR